MKITKKYIFEQKLKGEPISVYVNEVSNEEIQCMIDCGVVRQFTPNWPRRVEDLALVIALYPICHGTPIDHTQVGEGCLYQHKVIKYGDHVQLRSKSLISKET